MSGSNNKEARKFMFDKAFDVDAVSMHALSASVRERTYTEDRVEAIRAEAFAEGYARGVAAAMADISGETAGALTAISNHLRALAATAAEKSEEGTRQMLAIVGAAFAKLFPEWVKRQGQAEVDALIRACLAEFADEPRVLVRTHPALAANLAPYIDAIGQSAGFAGRIVLVPADEFAPAEARVEWADGGVERSPARLWQRIETIVQRFTGSPLENSALADPATIAPRAHARDAAE